MRISLALPLAVLAIFAAVVPGMSADPASDLRAKARKTMNDGNYADALGIFQELLSGKIENANPEDDFSSAMDCYGNLNKPEEREEFREGVLKTFKDDWRLIWRVAQSFSRENSWGEIVDNKFIRGGGRGRSGKPVNSFQRDRVRSLQLYADAYGKAPKKDNSPDGGYSLIIDFADALMRLNNGEAWRLQELTDLSALPDYDENGGYYRFGRGGSRGAPVDLEGNPIFYPVPANFAEAKSDGERWRFLLAQAAALDPSWKSHADKRYADFLVSQFGVQTLAGFDFYGEDDSDDETAADANPYAVHTLGEDETIAKLATGIKRFKLPDEHNYIRILREISRTGKQPADSALHELSGIFKDRRQYVKAAECLEALVKMEPDEGYKEELRQIVGDCGEFLPSGHLPAGRNPSLRIRYRNAKIASFEAFELKADQLIADVKKYIKSNPKELKWEKLDLNDIGRRIVQQNESKYIGAKVAGWKIELKPKKGHWDRVQNVEIPFSKGGAYLVTAKFGDGNLSRITLWLNDAVIVRKPGDNTMIYYCADAVSGRPLAGALVEFFGYSFEHLDPKLWNLGRRQNVIAQSFEAKTNADGISVLSQSDTKRGESWLVTMKSASGAISYMGFDSIWFMGGGRDEIYDGVKTYTITDRPVYRPDQEVKFKVWTGRTRYENLAEEISEYAGRRVNIKVVDSFNEKLFDETISADQWGGVEGRFKLKKDCHLGVHNIQIRIGNRRLGNGSFRVEEYKKPEFEVAIDKPSEPVALGEKITAKVRAKYYFGAPVANAKVKYKVERYQHNEEWFFPCRWDWLYGRGYWWSLPDYEWYPGWDSWGSCAPRCWWIPDNPAPPELVMENEVAIGEDGTVDIVIDSSVAKAIYGGRDQRYEITAEVVDSSRRTIFGKGSCIAAAKPFKVNSWTDAGWAKPGDAVTANFAVRTADGKGLAGDGKLSLFRVKYDKRGIPSEEILESWNLKTDGDGFATMKIKAGEKGQYRLSYVFEAKGAKGEGASIFSVFGDDSADAGYRFNEVEIVPRKGEYRDGEKALLRINTAKRDSTVLLFVRPRNGVYGAPEILPLKDGTVEHGIAVSRKDMPNFFVEAVTVADGKVHSIVKEIIVPPEKCALDVEILPSKEKYKPGEKAYATLKITDANGKALANSSVVVSVYDKAVEYISGGSNVPEIKEFFWKWRRNHYARTESSVDGSFWNILKEKESGLARLGIFEDIGLAEEIGVLGGDGGMMCGAVGSGGGRSFAKRSKGMMPPAPACMKAGAMVLCMAAAPMEAGDKADAGNAPGGGEASGENVAVRRNFADTAFWVANLATNERGEALVELSMPENLTTWKLKAWTMASGTRVGQGEAEVITSKDFILRLQAPRFFIEKDKVALSAVIHNYHNSGKKASAIIELDGDCLELLDEKDNAKSRKIEIAAGGEARVDWKVAAVAEGEAIVRMKAIADDDSDAMEMKFPVYVHGMTKTASFTSAIAPDARGGASVMSVPAERREDESVLEVRYSPSLALSLLDALPYMCEYPYGCTEQTLNKFVPLAIVRKTLSDMGLNLEAIAKKRTNFDSQQIGRPGENYAKTLRMDPVFDSGQFNDMVSTGLKMLEGMQLSDGGWGWFSGYGEHSYPHTTAVVVHGLITARNSGLEVNPTIIKRGLDWLARHQARELERLCKHHFEPGETCKEKHPDGYKPHADETDALVYMVLAEGGVSEEEMTRILYRDRNGLRVYAKALYALGLHFNGEKNKLDMLKRNISQHLVLDDENQTAYLDLGEGNWWWCWHGSEVEANAFYLKLLAATEPKSETSPRLVKYLLNNRRHATYWNSTRDTAYCIEAMADFIKASGENMPDMELEVLFDGKQIRKQRITADNLFIFDNAITLKGKDLGTGMHKLEFRKSGEGAIYYSAYLSYFTLEDFIEKTGLEIKVERRYYKLVRSEKKRSAADRRGQVVKQNVEKYDRVPVKNLDILKSGDLVEVELVVESKNDYEYLVFEDMKPAGLEPCEIRSGYNGNEMGAFVEFRDERVLFFARTLARGKHSVSYRMKAEIPGIFSALPTKGSAMYAPELKANSDEIKIGVED